MPLRRQGSRPSPKGEHPSASRHPHGRHPRFDAGGPGGDANGFAVFGHVVEGMDVIKAIYAAPTSPITGEGVMKGQMLEAPVKIIKAARVK